MKMGIRVSLDDEAQIRALRTRALINEDQLNLGMISSDEYRQTLEDIDRKLVELEVKYGLR